jgi:hypothetical protein
MKRLIVLACALAFIDIGGLHRPGVDGAEPAVAPQNATIPPDDNLYLLNSKQVCLSYAVTELGSSGIRRAVVYVTDDTGKSWRECAVDHANSGSIHAHLPGEGIYGFRLVLESRVGLSDGPPASGAAPEIRVEVDLTPPEVTIFPVKYDPGRPDGVTLTWKATDKNLADTIELSYAVQETGPWQVIATSKNTGEYFWKTTSKLPVRVYLKVTASDRAGNTGTAITGKLVELDFVKPKGRLTGIRAVPEVGDGSSRPAHASQKRQ